MLAAGKGITAKLIAIAVKRYQKGKGKTQEKRIKKHRTELQVALMLGGIRRVK